MISCQCYAARLVKALSAQDFVVKTLVLFAGSLSVVIFVFGYGKQQHCVTVTLRGGSLRGHSGIVFCWGPDGPHLVLCLLLVQLFYSCAWAIVLMKGSLWGSFYEMRVCIQAPGELQSLGWGKPLNSHLNYFTSFIYPVISVLVFTTNWIVLSPLEYTPDDYSQSKD